MLTLLISYIFDSHRVNRCSLFRTFRIYFQFDAGLSANTDSLGILLFFCFHRFRNNFTSLRLLLGCHWIITHKYLIYKLYIDIFTRVHRRCWEMNWFYCEKICALNGPASTHAACSPMLRKSHRIYAWVVFYDLLVSFVSVVYVSSFYQSKAI